MTASRATELIQEKISVVRNTRVMLGADLAALYGVGAGRLNEAVKRNRSRFPADFMFQLAQDEAVNLKSQNAISSSGWGGRRHLPYAFTQEGVAMLSGVLRSPRAVQVNVAIMRAFVRLRAMVALNKELAQKLDLLERKVADHDGDIHALFDAMRRLTDPAAEERRRIGFSAPGKD